MPGLPPFSSREAARTTGDERVTQPVRGRRRLTTMSDDSLLWTHKPVQRNRPRPGEPLWSVQRSDVTWTAELFFHGEGVGWEAKIFRDGELLFARTYLLRDVAVGWAKNERDRLGTDDSFW